ncbi:hypothetical protein EMIT079MI2_170025 [Bacillus sp. IT-79MI2]
MLLKTFIMKAGEHVKGEGTGCQYDLHFGLWWGLLRFLDYRKGCFYQLSR